MVLLCVSSAVSPRLRSTESTDKSKEKGQRIKKNTTVAQTYRSNGREKLLTLFHLKRNKKKSLETE
jgi:uncharacterized protein YxeA